MRNFYTANLDTYLDIEKEYATEPYEAAWASEALFFIRVDKAPKDAKGFSAAVQISVDGITWVDEGAHFENVSGEGDYFVRVRHFGGWLRLKGTLPEDEKYTVTTYLVLKE